MNEDYINRSTRTIIIFAKNASEFANLKMFWSVDLDTYLWQIAYNFLFADSLEYNLHESLCESYAKNYTQLSVMYESRDV